ncbi:hypothetical protein AADG42_01720 [Ammonicoccus fulvus]|uniref:VOC domain-containing protein n=1 Tax=Ammonicoccus fulvus TaxID=3138240 RepID=A0ABZ3FMN1_9ACTN
MLNQHTLHSVGVTVRDLEKTMAKIGQVFGIDDWEVAEVGRDRISDAVSRGRQIAGGAYRTATGTTTLRSDLVGGREARNKFPYRTVTFELVQPLKGESPFQEFLATRGQGVSHVVFNEGPEDSATVAAHLAAQGVPTLAAFTVDGERRVFHDTRASLGGFFVEVRPAGARTKGEAVNVSGAYERPDGVEPFPVIGVSHFGVVIDDLMATLPEYHRLLGCADFPIKNWTACLGSLDAPYFRDEKVDHAYFTGMGTCGDFQFEIIQPTFGPSDYNVGFRDVKGGPGVHHMLLYVTASGTEWDKTVKDMADLGHHQHMGSDLRGGAAEFCYFDTAKDVGFVVESVYGGKPDPVPAEQHLADPEIFEVDFNDLINAD